MEKKNGGPAFPNGETVGQCSILTGGMTLRDYFAGQVLTGIIGSGTELQLGKKYPESNENIAKVSYIVADAMIAECEK